VYQGHPSIVQRYHLIGRTRWVPGPKADPKVIGRKILVESYTTLWNCRLVVGRASWAVDPASSPTYGWADPDDAGPGV